MFLTQALRQPDARLVARLVVSRSHRTKKPPSNAGSRWFRLHIVAVAPRNSGFAC
jgi:hypothetical protein